MDFGFVPKLASKARLRFDRHAGKHMIVYPERGLALNDSAAAIVRRCDGTRTIRGIVEEIATEAKVPPEEQANLERDVVELIEELARKGLLAR